jgi:ribonuclease BN (tRNA processing enzyme)
MKLTVIGAGPAYTDRVGAVGASYLVTSGEATVLLDLGHGAFANLAGTLEPSTLSAIAISHLHPDHFIDLVPLRHYLRYEFHPPRRVTVLAPAALTERLDALLAQPGFSAESLDVVPLADGLQRVIGTLRLEARKVTHTDDSYAFRVSPIDASAYQTLAVDRRVGDGGVTGSGSTPGLVYSGDCGRGADLRPLIQPGDVLLSEVSFGLGPVPPGAFHLDADDVGALAAEAGASRILLTHLLSGRDRAATEAAATRAAGGISARLVDPGDRFDL